jgi:hypothetical protein
MQAKLTTTQAGAYTVHEIQTPTGTVVREYVSKAGNVFAVAWRGPWIPNLQELLGKYFGEFQAAVQGPNRHPGHMPLSVHQPDLAVEMSGHMRDFSGRAYLVREIPAGVDLKWIQ